MGTNSTVSRLGVSNDEENCRYQKPDFLSFQGFNRLGNRKCHDQTNRAFEWKDCMERQLVMRSKESPRSQVKSDLARRIERRSSHMTNHS